MVPNRATHHIFDSVEKCLKCCSVKQSDDRGQTMMLLGKVFVKNILVNE